MVVLCVNWFKCTLSFLSLEHFAQMFRQQIFWQLRCSLKALIWFLREKSMIVIWSILIPFTYQWSTSTESVQVYGWYWMKFSLSNFEIETKMIAKMIKMEGQNSWKNVFKNKKFLAFVVKFKETFIPPHILCDSNFHRTNEILVLRSFLGYLKRFKL